jgi:hypothetical protein
MAAHAHRVLLRYFPMHPNRRFGFNIRFSLLESASRRDLGVSTVHPLLALRQQQLGLLTAWQF